MQYWSVEYSSMHIYNGGGAHACCTAACGEAGPQALQAANRRAGPGRARQVGLDFVLTWISERSCIEPHTWPYHKPDVGDGPGGGGGRSNILCKLSLQNHI